MNGGWNMSVFIEEKSQGSPYTVWAFTAKHGKKAMHGYNCRDKEALDAKLGELGCEHARIGGSCEFLGWMREAMRI